jgi:hypothetical protein
VSFRPEACCHLSVGARFFVLAGSIRTTARLDSLRATIGMPLRVVRLDLPLPEIEARLQSDVTSGRRDDLRQAAASIAAGEGIGIEDLTVLNDRPVRQVATGILGWLGWL